MATQIRMSNQMKRRTKRKRKSALKLFSDNLAVEHAVELKLIVTLDCINSF